MRYIVSYWINNFTKPIRLCFYCVFIYLFGLASKTTSTMLSICGEVRKPSNRIIRDPLCLEANNLRDAINKLKRILCALRRMMY